MKKKGLRLGFDILSPRACRGAQTASGFAIILVLATLVLLALLSLTYIKLALIDRNIARNYMDNKRAKLIAQSGIEYAIARMQEMQEINPFDSTWQYKDNLLNPSFASGEVTINGKTVGYTQVAGNTYDKDIFILKIKDNQGAININDGLGNPRVRANLARIINNLVKQNTVIGPASPDIGFDIVGTEIEEKRPYGGYSNVSEIRRVLTSKYGAIAEDYYNRLEPFVTTHAWQDPNVANPVPLSGWMVDLPVYPVKYNQNIGIYRYGRGKAMCTAPDTYEMHVIGSLTCAKENCSAKYAQLKFAPEGIGSPLGTGDPRLLEHAIYGLDELNPQWIEIVSRSPVNVNAAPREVLIALIKDLKGLFVVERKANVLLNKKCLQLNYSYLPLSVYYDYGPNPAISNPDDIPMGSWMYDGFKNNMTTIQYLEDGFEPYFDELGFIYSTADINHDFVGDAGLAKKIADEIVECRDKGPAYSSVWFKGPFKNWRQFNAFCDYLLTKPDLGDPSKKILQDTRDIFYEYRYTYGESKSAVVGHRLVPSAIARQYASQALSDTLKANFNPNLHLNELNPDVNQATFVDKTDLIVNSTEFCFTPMGYFDIESKGVILRQETVITQSRYKASAKLYDAYRESTQRQFLEGQIPTTAAKTNNGKTLEIGPELGETISKENNWSGYISLPTLRGPGGFDSTITSAEEHYKKQGKWKTKTTTVTEYPLCRLYSQFTTGFDADYHVNQGTSPTAVQNQYKTNMNRIFSESARTETTLGPYNYGDAGTRKYRLAKGYYYDNAGSLIASDSSSELDYYAVAALRKDGVYIERPNCIAYKLKTVHPMVDQEVLEEKGILSYWIKPWFHPEMTGKHRVFASAGFVKLRAVTSMLGTPGVASPNPFTHWFISGHVNDPDFDVTLEDSVIDNTLVYPGTVDIRPLSMVFGYATINDWWDESNDANGDGLPDGIPSYDESGGVGTMTPTLNHLSHFNLSCHLAGSSPRPNYLRASQWIHVILLYDKLPTNTSDPFTGNYLLSDTVNEYTEIYVNGSIIPATDERIKGHTEEQPLNGPVPPGGFHGGTFFLIYMPHLKLGHPLKFSDDYNLPTPQTATCDSTVDEFYVFSARGKTTTSIKETDDETGTSIALAGGGITYTDSTLEAFNLAKGMWDQGRYYKSATEEIYFTSSNLKVVSESKLPETSIIAPPTPEGTGSLSDLNVRKIIGLSWTWFAEGTDTTTGKAVLKNYKDFVAADGSNSSAYYLYPTLKVRLLKNGAEQTEDTDDAFSKVEVDVSSSDTIQYRVLFDLSGFPNDAVLLYSPIFDDITIYYTSGVKFLSYSYFD